MTTETIQAQDVFNATLTRRQDLTDELAVIRVQPDSGEIPDFEPGQYTTLGLPEYDEAGHVALTKRGKPKLIRRPYSIASSPNEEGELEFYLIVVEDGALTPKLWHMGEGDRLYMDAKCRGNFTLNGIPENQNLVMISTGTGLAPYVSMLRTYRRTGFWHKAIVIHGTRLAQDLGYRRELEQLAAEDEDIIYIPMCTREPEDSDWDGLRGRVHHALEPEQFKELTGEALDPQTCQLFLCGNPAMIDQVEEEMQTVGFSTYHKKNNPEGNIHLERYW
jgi:ferredoxin--NADP+ reductase